MTKAKNVNTAPVAQAAHAPTHASTAVEGDLQLRCNRVLEMLLTQRGDASAAVEHLLADDPACVFAHCLRAGSIVRSENTAAWHYSLRNSFDNRDRPLRSRRFRLNATVSGR